MELLEYINRWNSQRLGSLFREQKKKNTHFARRNALKFTYGSIVDKPEYDMTPSLIDTYSKYTLVDEGDIVINCLNLNYDFVSQRVAIVKNSGIITSAYISLRARNADINPLYYCYYFKAMDACKMFHGMGTGIRLTLSYNELRNVPIPVPPRAEQDQIVRFLDWKVSEINKLIRIKREQIKGYTEYEKKVINDKILHGLRNETLKESGDQWLGKIPISWKVIKLGRFCSFQNGISESGDFFTSGTPFVGYGDVYRHLELPETVNGVAKANKQQQEMFSVHKGDIFFTRTSENIEEIGMAAVCNHTIEKAIFSGFLIRCRPRLQIINMDFMKYYLQIPAVRNHFSSMMNIVIRASLGQNLLKQMPVVVPSLEEQKEIAIYLDSLHEKFTRLIDATQKEILTMMELKNRLISDVVTGKIDVRDIAVPEYEHVDDIADDDSDVDEESAENETEIDGEEA